MIVSLIFHRNDSNDQPHKEEHIVAAMSFGTTLKDYVLSQYLNATITGKCNFKILRLQMFGFERRLQFFNNSFL